MADREKARKYVTETGIEVKPVYTARDLPPDYDPGLPGEYPFTRGIHPGMYRDRVWLIRQYTGFGTAEDTNTRFKNLMKQGQTGLSLALDLPTQMGYDSDDPMVEGEVGRVGLAIDTLRDMEMLFEGIPLAAVNTSINVNATTPIIFAMFIAAAKKQGADVSALRGTLQNDILKEFISRGTFVFPPGPSVKLLGDVVEYGSNHLPKFRAINVSGGHIRDTGANGVQEIGLALANAFAYLDELTGRGLDIDKVAPQFSFLFNSKMNFFEEAAKFRAARQLWATVLRERYGAKEPKSLKMSFFSGTSNNALTKQEPLNNIVRLTLEFLGSVLGGAQACTVIGYDEPYDIPSELAQRVGLRTQQILAYETVVPYTADPLAGSYFVESLTLEIRKRVEEFLTFVQEHGGIVSLIESGEIQKLVYDQAYQEELSFMKGEKQVLGVNLYPSNETDGLLEENALHEADPNAGPRQVARLQAVKAERSGEHVSRTLAQIRQQAAVGENLMPSVIEAVEAYATVGEIVGALEQVYGRYREGGVTWPAQSV